MGFYCVDNLPVVLLPDLARTLADRAYFCRRQH
ncbi:RNase adapter RapZ [Escherichia coli]